ncbi:hypothetical protein [Nocardioides sp. cx-173]|uniref:hypothetical protein n=1 Tax=Nocardioides sp. cx-173 TaxID=2898796 RepID=UPI001E57D0A5|nr:hypothetical protein [Nocardioides sp. cx-173]MCD4525719.1 hypothetical protein [Nocardioides sp. cx-173]UGB43967.1 hypothetical protein LQ940_10720 [Nocardioides sp. cx-173]
MTRPTKTSAALAALATLATLTAVPPASADAPPAARPAATRLTNLAHLDWLSVEVAPPAQPRHTTYRLAQEPEVGVLWTYAEPEGDGSYRHVGGGDYDAATDTWGQGAFNADDVSRAAVVYLRHWRQTGDDDSRDRAYAMLRGLTYLQTSSGPDAGNVVLWMQPDGTLNPSAEPVELPDPSDSDASYWVARTIWALGEGYAAFAGEDPAFAAFLRRRLLLSVDAVRRQVLDRYGDRLVVDGQRGPAWLIADGADASAEAVLGLSAYVEAVGGARAGRARAALAKLAEGVAMLRGGDARAWPFGGVRPWALSRSLWHAWGSQMPAALARASRVLQDPALARVAASDSFGFDPWLLTSGGPDNGRMPTRGDASQIAYGADSRLQSLLATREVTGRRAAGDLAGVVAAWYFGANPAGERMYDPATGRTFDGISATGEVNRNSGAESTIHGLLSMIALDAHPRIRAAARVAEITGRRGTQTLEAEDASLSGDATVRTPASLWTGESLYGGTGYVALGDGGTAGFDVRTLGRSLVLPVLDLRPGSDAVTTLRAGRTVLGEARSGRVGRQGASPAAGALLPVTMARLMSAGATRLTARTATDGAPAKLDAVMVVPVVSRLVLRSRARGTALLSSVSRRPEHVVVRVAGRGRAVVRSYDRRGRLVAQRWTRARAVPVVVPAGGFALVMR